MRHTLLSVLGSWYTTHLVSDLFESGLIVKQALIEARKTTNDPSMLQIYNNSYGIIFFGTPHRGSEVASWGRLFKNIAQAAQIDANGSILTDLDPKSGSSKLEELRLDFDDVLRDSQRAEELRVFSFQEEQGMTGVNLLGGKVSHSNVGFFDFSKCILVMDPMSWSAKYNCGRGICPNF